jgi:hypothetical protein
MSRKGIPCWIIEKGKVRSFKSLSELEIKNATARQGLRVAYQRAITAGLTSFISRGVMVYLSEPVIVGGGKKQSIRIQGPADQQYRLIPNPITHGLAQLWR